MFLARPATQITRTVFCFTTETHVSDTGPYGTIANVVDPTDVQRRVLCQLHAAGEYIYIYFLFSLNKIMYLKM